MTWLRSSTSVLLAAGLCTIAAVAAGCGSSANSLAGADAAKLHDAVAAIRSAASAHNPAAAHMAVRSLEADVAELKAGGRLAPADASVLLSDAGQVDRRVSLEVRAPAASTTASPTTTTTPASPAPAGPPASPGGGHGHGHGHGHGNGGGDGNGNGKGGGGDNGGD